MDILALIPFWFYIGNELHKYILEHSDSDTANEEELLANLQNAFGKLRILHIIRICKLGQYSRGVKVLGKTLVESRSVLSMLGTMQFISCFVFAAFSFFGDQFFEGFAESNNWPVNRKYNCSGLEDAHEYLHGNHSKITTGHATLYQPSALKQLKAEEKFGGVKDDWKIRWCNTRDTTLGIKSIFDGMYWSIITMTTVGYGDIIPATMFGQLVGSACAMCGILAIAFPVPIGGV